MTPNRLKRVAVVAAVIAAWFVMRWLTGPSSRGIDAPPIDPSSDPIQEDDPEPKTVSLSFKGGEAQLSLVAGYTAAVKICGRKKYYSPWAALVAPYDLCLSWGKLATDELKGKIKFSQDMRWYQYYMSADSALPMSYISQHSSNTHLIYANDNLLKAVKRLGKGDVVELKGYLVNLKGKYKDTEMWWNSSLRRDDTGAGACELLYLTSLRKGDRLYE